MKIKFRMLVLFCIFTTQCPAQGYQVVINKLADLKIEYDVKLFQYQVEKRKLEEPKNIADETFDTNGQKKIVADLSRQIHSILETENILKEAFKGEIPLSEMQAAFPTPTNNDFILKAPPAETGVKLETDSDNPQRAGQQTTQQTETHK